MFVKGSSGNPKGRPKGTTKSNDLLKAVQDHIEQKYGIKDYDPVIALADTANDPSANIKLRVSCHSEVARYVRPQLKAVEITGDIDVNMEAKVQIVDRLFGALARATEQKREESEDGGV